MMERTLETEQVTLALKPLSPCTLIEVTVECLQACQSRHSHYNAVISLPTHQHPACWVDPFIPLLSSLFLLWPDSLFAIPFSSQEPWVLQWCIPVPQHSGQGWHPPYISLEEIYWQQISVSPLHCSPVDFSSQSFSVCILLLFFPNPVKWPYQVLRYVSDAATHAPALRFGKEMSTKSRLQGRPYSLSTFFPVQKQRFSQWRALQCSLFVLCFATVLIPFWCKLQSYVPVFTVLFS